MSWAHTLIGNSADVELSAIVGIKELGTFGLNGVEVSQGLSGQ